MNMIATRKVVTIDNTEDNPVIVESTISADLKIFQEFSQAQVLPSGAGLFFDIFTTTGSNTVSGMMLQFNDNDIEVRLMIDSITIFLLNCSKLKEIADWNTAPLPAVYTSWNDTSKTFFFTPMFPIKSTVDIFIQARSNSAKQYEASIIQVG